MTPADVPTVVLPAAISGAIRAVRPYPGGHSDASSVRGVRLWPRGPAPAAAALSRRDCARGGPRPLPRALLVTDGETPVTRRSRWPQFVPLRAEPRQSVPMTTTQPRLSGIETRSIDYVPLNERHGKIWHLGPLWFMSNAQIATLAVGLISTNDGPSLL